MCLLAHSMTATATMPYDRGVIRAIAAASDTTCEVRLTQAGATRSPTSLNHRTQAPPRHSNRHCHAPADSSVNNLLRQRCVNPGRCETIESGFRMASLRRGPRVVCSWRGLANCVCMHRTAGPTAARSTVTGGDHQATESGPRTRAREAQKTGNHPAAATVSHSRTLLPAVKRRTRKKTCTKHRASGAMRNVPASASYLAYSGGCPRTDCVRLARYNRMLNRCMVPALASRRSVASSSWSRAPGPQHHRKAPPIPNAAAMLPASSGAAEPSYPTAAITSLGRHCNLASDGPVVSVQRADQISKNVAKPGTKPSVVSPGEKVSSFTCSHSL